MTNQVHGDNGEGAWDDDWMASAMGRHRDDEKRAWMRGRASIDVLGVDLTPVPSPPKHPSGPDRGNATA
jgi:hypothetical protein